MKLVYIIPICVFALVGCSTVPPVPYYKEPILVDYTGNKITVAKRLYRYNMRIIFPGNENIARFNDIQRVAMSVCVSGKKLVTMNNFCGETVQVYDGFALEYYDQCSAWYYNFACVDD